MSDHVARAGAGALADMGKLVDNPAVVTINTAAALLTVGQFVLLLLGVSVNTSFSPSFMIRLGDGTTVVLFLLFEAALLYVPSPIVLTMIRRLNPAIAMAALVAVGILMVLFVCYATQINYNFFFAGTYGSFDPTRLLFSSALVLVAIVEFFIIFATAVSAE